MPKNDGGPAIPSYEHAGMSLRDYFAAAALQSIMPAGCFCQDKTLCKQYANSAYIVADAMLAERDKHE